jgi:hypothetical protein
MLSISPGKRGKLFGYGWLYDAWPGQVNPTTAPLEGAFKMYLDGSTVPNYETGGSEDEFGMGWYFNHATTFGIRDSLAPTNGDVVLTVQNPNWTWGAHRFFINDPITFENALRFSWTCGNTSVLPFSGTCTLRSTVYYYTEN